MQKHTRMFLYNNKKPCPLSVKACELLCPVVTVWNSETPTRPDKVETGEVWLLHFKGKLHFINFFLWVFPSCVRTTEDQKGTNYTVKNRPSEVGPGYADFESVLMLV